MSDNLCPRCGDVPLNMEYGVVTKWACSGTKAKQSPYCAVRADRQRISALFTDWFKDNMNTSVFDDFLDSIVNADG